MTTFTNEDIKEAMLKAFELFAMCMESGPCNNCVFFDGSLQEDPCSIGCPNYWPLFDTGSENGRKNRDIVLNILRRKENKQSEIKDPVIEEYLNRIANGGDTYPSDVCSLK